MNNGLFLYGASGHAKVILEILESRGIKALGLFDDNEQIESILDYPVQPYRTGRLEMGELIISVGNNRTRKMLAGKLPDRFATAVHAGAELSPRCTIGKGTVIMAGVSINASTVIGNHCIVNTNASVDHDCELGDFVHISPNVALCGNVRVGEGTHIGAGSVVIPGISIGRWCVIGAGSVVLRDLPDHTSAWGNPCRIIKTNEPYES
jgi:sugar O-acyltransferase (sialic acid O-acetyltransferase NeuD family)